MYVILHTRAHTSSIKHAIRVLQDYIVTRLVSNNDETWTESATVTLISFMIFENREYNNLELAGFHDSLDKVHQVMGKALSKEATDGALVVSSCLSFCDRRY